MKNNKIIVSLVILSALTACGGGGGSSPTTTTPPTTTPVATTCPGGEKDFPICSAIGQLQQAVPSTYTPNSNEYAFFTEWNMVRSKMGMGPVNHNVLIDKAVQNHANYLHQSAIAGEDGHGEVAGRSGFTGATPAARMVFAGYSNLKYGGEVIAPRVGTSAFYGLMNAIYHREGLLNEWTTDAGMVSTASSGSIVNYGYVNPQWNNGNYVGMYPYDGETSVSLTHSLESPNPFAGELDMTGVNMCTKTSSPISVLSESSTSLSVTSFTVREYGSDKDLSVRLWKQGTQANTARPLNPNHVAIVGNAPFKPYQRYEVKFVGKVSGGRSGNGFDVSKAWSFTTSVNLKNTCNF